MLGAVEGVVGGAEPSSTQPAVTAEEEAPALRPPTTVPQEHNAPEGAIRVVSPQEHDAPEGTTRAASSEIQEAGESSGATLPRDVGGSDARVLELARVPWAAAFKVGDDVEGDEEAASYNTLERGLAWAHRAFDELILPAMLVSLRCANNAFLISRVLSRCVAHLRLVRDRYSRHLVGGERTR
jgi:hypothetical protein